MDRISAGLSAILRAPRSAEHEALLASLSPDEWTAVVDMAIRQGVGPQVSVEDLHQLPAAAATRLKERTLAATDRSLRYREEFLSLAAGVESQGIQIVALKGIHLAFGVYPPTVVREMADIDVLVRHDQVELVAEAAHRLGYRTKPGAMDRRPHHLQPLIKSGAVLEIHWQLAEPGIPPAAPPDDLWPRIRPLAAGANAYALAPEDALIHISAHAAYSHHLEQGVRPLRDVRALIASCGPQMDWDAVAARALKWDCSRGVILALSLARDLLGAELPGNIIESLGGAPPSSVAAAAVGQVFGPRTAMHGVSGAAGQLLEGSSPWVRLRNAMRHLKLPPEQIAALYPGWSRGSPVLLAWVMARRGVVLVRRYAWILLRTAFQPHSLEGRHVAQRNKLRRWLKSGA